MFYETMLWLMVFIITIAILIGGMAYLTSRLGKISIISKNFFYKKVKKNLVSLGILMTFILLVSLLLGYVNAVVIVITITMFSLVCELIFLLLKRLTNWKGKRDIYYPGILTIAVSLVYLATVFFGPSCF